MRFEKKEPEIRIQPFNPHKNPWQRCRCTFCQVPYDGQSYTDTEGKTYLDWSGQSLSGGYVWECAKCRYEQKVV
jgi:hypothetical protein